MCCRVLNFEKEPTAGGGQQGGDEVGTAWIGETPAQSTLPQMPRGAWKAGTEPLRVEVWAEEGLLVMVGEWAITMLSLHLHDRLWTLGMLRLLYLALGQN